MSHLVYMLGKSRVKAEVYCVGLQYPIHKMKKLCLKQTIVSEKTSFYQVLAHFLHCCLKTDNISSYFWSIVLDTEIPIAIFHPKA